MKTPFPLRLATTLIALTVTWTSQPLLRAAEPAPRQYAADREAQVTHLQIDVTPDFAKRTITGTAVIRFKPVALPLPELKLDAGSLTVQSVTATAKVRAWHATDNAITVTFATPVPAAQETTVTVTYTTEPKRGIYFRTPEMGYKEGETHLFSQGEENDNRYWYPCLDAPDQIFTSELTCHVPEGMTVVSNGRLVSREKDPAGLVAFHWSQEKPLANYLVTLVAGYFKKIEAKYGELPLAFYTLPSEIGQAQTSFRDTPDMLAFFEKDIGVPYPWAKYDQICVNDFVAGGMENTSATTLTDSTLFTPASEDIHNSDPLVAHELAHQWFGDLVTCKDWSQTWLNEGFATYYETLYSGHKEGRETMLYELRQRVRHLTAGNDDKAIVRRTFTHSSEMFSDLSYAKGGMVLHMLRCELGDALYRQCVKAYLEKYRFGNVDTEDFRKVIEQTTGRTYDRFFDQWIYHGRFPDLELTCTWDEPSKTAKVSVRQTQDVNEQVLLFHVPLTLRFKVNGTIEDRTIQITRKQEDFSLPLAAAPEFVLPDPEVALLARIKFTLDNTMIPALLADPSQVVGRLRAIEQISGQKDGENIARLKKALKEDSFYGIRLEASQALRAIHNDDALAALIDSVAQPDARVRRQVITDIAGFNNEKAYEVARDVLRSEKNPDIVAVAIRALGAYLKPEVRPTLTEYLNSESYHNELANAAIEAMRKQEDPACASLLLETLQRRGKGLTRSGVANGLDAVAYLARNEEQKDAYREFLAGYIQDDRRSVRLAAIKALGTLGDPKAISLLDSFTTASSQDSERTAAEGALQTLRTINDKEKGLRDEITSLKKSNAELKQQLEAVKNSARATPEVEPASASAPTLAPRKSKPILRSPKVAAQGT